MPNSQELIEEVFHQRQTAHALRHQVFQHHDPWKALDLQTLIQTEEALGQAEKALAPAPKNSALPGSVILQSPENMNRLGPDTTSLAAISTLKMAQIPTSIYHLLNAKEDPLIHCWVRNYASETRRLRVSSFIEGYSATAVDTFELENGGEKTIPLLPTLFPEPARALNELTRATLNVMIEEIDGQVELHRTTPVWLLARTNVPLAVQDPTDGSWRDLTRYLVLCQTVILGR